MTDWREKLSDDDVMAVVKGFLSARWLLNRCDVAWEDPEDREAWKMVERAEQAIRKVKR